MEADIFGPSGIAQVALRLSQCCDHTFGTALKKTRNHEREDVTVPKGCANEQRGCFAVLEVIANLGVMKLYAPVLRQSTSCCLQATVRACGMATHRPVRGVLIVSSYLGQDVRLLQVSQQQWL